MIGSIYDQILILTYRQVVLMELMSVRKEENESMIYVCVYVGGCVGGGVCVDGGTF